MKAELAAYLGDCMQPAMPSHMAATTGVSTCMPVTPSTATEPSPALGTWQEGFCTYLVMGEGDDRYAKS